jgi:hypothetical protein
VPKSVALRRSLALLLVVAPARAGAQAVPSVDVRTWAPAADPRASLVLEPLSIPDEWHMSLAAWTRFENDTVTIRDPLSGAVQARPVQDLIGVDLLLSFALGSRGLVGVRVPFTLDEQGTGSLPASIVSPAPNPQSFGGSGGNAVPAQSFGDVALLGKGTILDNRRGGFGLAALGELTLPSGAGTSFTSDASGTGTLRLAGDYAVRGGSLQASLGYMVRPDHIQWPTGAGVTFGDTIPWTLGVLVRPSNIPPLHGLDPGARQTWELALHGSLPGGPVGPFGLGQPGSAAESPALLALSDRVELGHHRDGFFVAGVDVGIDHAIGVPSFRAMLGLVLRIADRDKDGDGIDDDVDQCPTLAEDRDGFEDQDGCPEADNDDDGVIDAEDACPNVPGVRSPDRSKNGCPAEVTPSREPPPPR